MGALLLWCCGRRPHKHAAAYIGFIFFGGGGFLSSEQSCDTYVHTAVFFFFLLESPSPQRCFELLIQGRLLRILGCVSGAFDYGGVRQRVQGL